MKVNSIEESPLNNLIHNNSNGKYYNILKEEIKLRDNRNTILDGVYLDHPIIIYFNK